MKLKRVLLALAGVLTFSLAACSQAEGGGSSSGSGDSGPSDSESGDSGQTDASALSFMGNNKIRVDIMDNLGITFKYNDETVVSKSEITIVNNATFTYSGECTVDKINYIAYGESDTRVSKIWQCGNDSADFLISLPTYKFNDYKKIYIAISSGEPKWTTGLSTELDNYFNRQKNASI